MYDVAERMQALVSHTHRREAANRARALMTQLHDDRLVRPGSTMDRILDDYLAILERAQDAP